MISPLSFPAETTKLPSGAINWGPSGLRERVNSPFFCRENLEWNFFMRECVKQDTCVNVKEIGHFCA